MGHASLVPSMHGVLPRSLLRRVESVYLSRLGIRAIGHSSSIPVDQVPPAQTWGIEQCGGFADIPSETTAAGVSSAGMLAGLEFSPTH